MTDTPRVIHAIKIKKNGWRPVVYAHDCEPCDCCEEPICPNCGGEHYADCRCPGPMQEDEYEYKEIMGMEYARRKLNA